MLKYKRLTAASVETDTPTRQRRSSFVHDLPSPCHYNLVCSKPVRTETRWSSSILSLLLQLFCCQLRLLRLNPPLKSALPTPTMDNISAVITLALRNHSRLWPHLRMPHILSTLPATICKPPTSVPGILSLAMS